MWWDISRGQVSGQCDRGAMLTYLSTRTTNKGWLCALGWSCPKYQLSRFDSANTPWQILTKRASAFSLVLLEEKYNSFSWSQTMTSKENTMYVRRKDHTMRLATDINICVIVHLKENHQNISLWVWRTPKVWMKSDYTYLWRYRTTWNYQRLFQRCCIPLKTNRSGNISTAMATANESIKVWPS